MKKTLVRLGIAAGVTLGLLALVVLAVPSLRMLVLGSPLKYTFRPNFPKMHLQMVMSEAAEVRGPDQTGKLELPSGDELQMELKEEVQSGPREQTVFYVCGETRTEADSTRQLGRRLSGARLMARVLGQGGVVGAQAVDHRQEMFFQGSALRPLFDSVWPPLPNGYMRPASHWQADLRVEVEHKLLAEPVVLLYRVTYTLERFISESGIRAADISWRGQIEALAPAVGSGNFTGACLLGLDSGNCLNGGYNLVQSVDVPLRDLPGDMHLAWQQEQIARYTRLK